MKLPGTRLIARKVLAFVAVVVVLLIFFTGYGGIENIRALVMGGAQTPADFGGSLMASVAVTSPEGESRGIFTNIIPVQAKSDVVELADDLADATEKVLARWANRLLWYRSDMYYSSNESTTRNPTPS